MKISFSIAMVLSASRFCTAETQTSEHQIPHLYKEAVLSVSPSPACVEHAAFHDGLLTFIIHMYIIKKI
jgi:hypothetical protein